MRWTGGTGFLSILGLDLCFDRFRGLGCSGFVGVVFRGEPGGLVLGFCFEDVAFWAWISLRQRFCA
jgi:hypothetical protein